MNSSFNAKYVAMMLDYLVHTFILGAYEKHLFPNVVDCTALDDTTLEITMTDEGVYIVKVEVLAFKHR